MNPKGPTPQAVPRRGTGVPASPLTEADVALMVGLVGLSVAVTYDQATVDFKGHPSADNWKALVLSMHGVQFWCDADAVKQREAAQRLHGLGVGHWAQALQDLHRKAFED